MSPRPILKRAHSTEQHTQQYLHHHHRHIHHPHNAHGVHFPPSPSLTRTFTAYSATAYDRSPIVVSPNTCALPERGCPGRTYLLDEHAAPAPRARGLAYARDYHPRALAFASASHSQVPPLVPDLSSESDESDGFYSMPASTSSQHTFTIHGLAGPNGNGTSAKYSNSNYSNSYSNNYSNSNSNNTVAINTDDGYADAYAPCDDDPLAFLPYAPSSPPPAPSAHFAVEQDEAHKARYRRSGSDRRHESSADPDRIPRRGVAGDSAVGVVSLGMSALSISPPSPASSSPQKRSAGTPPRKKGVRRTVPVQLPPSFSGLCASDDGCLGGF